MENQNSTQAPTIQPNYIKKALYWFFTPIVLRFLVWGVFIATTNNIKERSLLTAINYILGLIGLFTTIAIPIGVIVGVIYLIKTFKAKK